MIRKAFVVFTGSIAESVVTVTVAKRCPAAPGVNGTSNSVDSSKASAVTAGGVSAKSAWSCPAHGFATPGSSFGVRFAIQSSFTPSPPLWPGASMVPLIVSPSILP